MNKQKSISFKTTSLLYLTAFIWQILYPSISWALSGREHQPEYMSYESFGSTDMVNLSTGDFTYNHPLLEIPGPEGSFKLPLAYHGGIGLEEEASWVGLGWSINPGTINRQKSGLPDDFAGQIINTVKQNDGGSRSTTTVNLGIASFSYDSQRGVGGFFSIPGSGLTLGYGYNTSIGFGGVTLSKQGVTASPGFGLTVSISDQGTYVDFDAVQGVHDAVTLAASEAAISHVGSKYGPAAASKAKSSYDAISEIHSLSKSIIGNISNIGTKTATQGDWTVELSRKPFTTIYDYYLDINSSLNGYGAIYLSGVQNNHIKYDGSSEGTYYDAGQVNPGQYPGNDRPPGPQLQFNGGSAFYAPTYFSPTPVTGNTSFGRISDNFEYHHSSFPNDIRPNNISYDRYIVNGGGVSGGITPYRVDVGSLAPLPIKRIGDYNRYHVLHFLPYSEGPKYLPKFRYVGEPVNNYEFHKNSQGWGNLEFVEEHFPHRNVAKFRITGNEVQYGSHFESDRLDGSYLNKSLRFGKHIEWATNWDLMSSSLNYSPTNYFGTNPIYEGKIMDHLMPSERSSFRSSFPKLGIGGFSITNIDGNTYHYTLPIFARYDYEEYRDGSNRNTYSNPNEYAVHWLLTGITGPDFVDANSNGTIDDEDFGYWVKLDYGKFSQNYFWRDPYLSGMERVSPTNNSQFYHHSGFRQAYYLNSIRTRTHRALFIKSLREDGKSSYDRTVDNTSDPNGIKNFPSSSLKLDEIVLIRESDFDEITTSGGISLNNSSDSDLRNGDTFSEVWDVSDFNASQINLLYSKQISRTKFNYWDPAKNSSSELLCKGTWNSFPNADTPPRGSSAGTGGKLTLLSISEYGSDNSKAFPDYQFEYSSTNPDYGFHQFDGWGMFKLNGTSDNSSHTADGASYDAYCLKKITMPSGSELEVKYERDTYSSLAGEPIDLKLSITSYSSSNGTITFANNVNLLDFFYEDQTVRILGLPLLYKLIQANQIEPVFERVIPVNVDATLKNLTSNSFKIEELNAILQANSQQDCYDYNNFPGNQGTERTCFELLETGYSIGIVVPFKEGGNNRVKELSFSGGYGFGAKTDKYVYNKEGSTGNDAVTSGIASYEPEYVSNWNREFSKFYNFPKTPIMYSEVNILKNFNDNDGSYEKRIQMSYHSLEKDLIDYNIPISRYTQWYKRWHSGPESNKDYRDTHSGVLLSEVNVIDKSSLVGKINKIATFNSEGNLISMHNYNYEESNEGVFSDATLTLDRVKWDGWTKFPDVSHYSQDLLYRYLYRFFRTKKWNINYRLTSIESYSEGITEKEFFTEIDNVTGEVLEKEYSNSKGDKFKTKVIPAYKVEKQNGSPVYDGMGSKFENPLNKNILNAPAAKYVYFSGSENKDWNTISANIQTWANDWEYRNYNSTSGEFEQNQTVTNDAYRKKATYVWNGSVNKNGAYENFTDFNWDNISNNPAWLKTSEHKLYDHYSHLLEKVDVAGKGVATKMNTSNSLVLAQATNSHYTEFAFSGAEDELTVDGNFGGEVRKGSGSVVVDQTSSPVHTGNKAIALDQANDYGFVFKKKIENGKSKRLRASVWVHQTNMDRLRLAYNYYDTDASTSVDNGEISPSAGNAYLKAGDWYLVVLDIPAVNGSAADWLHVETYYPSGQAAGVVVIDDFRVHPFDGNMTASVYDESTGELVASVNADGLCEKFEYDAAGRLMRIYEEVPDYNGKTGGFKLRKELDYGYSRSY